MSTNNNDLNTKNSRRRFIQTSAAIAASALTPSLNLFAATDITGQLAAYMAGARNQELPPETLLDEIGRAHV